jgi:hypothetical protein
MKSNRGSVADMWLNSFEDREMGTPPLDKITQDERKSYEIYFLYSKKKIHVIRKHAEASYE